MTSPSIALQPLSLEQGLRITPTDVSQFVRLDQCQRFLRLRLAERVHGADFLYEAGVTPQDPPPLMMLGGTDFEADVYGQIRRNRPTRDLREQSPRPKDDGAAVLAAIDALPPGGEIVLLQPRLRAQVGRWQLSGDVDVLKLAKDMAGRTSALIVDVKSSAVSKVEHRLQIAFYARMLSAISEGTLPDVQLGVLYRGDDAAGSEEDLARFRTAAFDVLGAEAGYLELVEEAEPFLAACDDLVTGPSSTAERIVCAEFDQLSFHLTYRCDWCRFNPFCMRWAAEHDDLSLIPYLTENDKLAIKRTGIDTAKELSLVKVDGPDGTLVANPARPETAAKLAVTWPIGARLDEVVQRARRYRAWKGDPVTAEGRLSHRGYGTLPYSDANQNPNLVRVYLDAQHDGQTGHVYLIGALVAAAEGGAVSARRRATIVRMAERPPVDLDDERDLLLGFIDELLRTLVALAAPDAEGQARAPIHLIFFNRFDQGLFLDALARHAATILGATPLYDFVTQLAAFDSPVTTFLVDEIRELRNYPMLSQSLQSVARFLRFDWYRPLPFPKLFHERMFDYVGKFDDGDPTAPGGSPWYTSRSRFDSQIPAEYAYAAWDALPQPAPGKADPFEPYRAATAGDLRAFQARRLEAMEHIAADFPGNKDTTKTAFELPDLAASDQKGTSLAQALAEFVTIERHVELAGWKSARLAPPELRVLAGHSLVVVYDEADQAPGVTQRMRECHVRAALNEQYRADYRAANPDAKQVRLTKEQKASSSWSLDGVELRLRLETEGVDCSLAEALELTTLREGDTLVLTKRWEVDSRLPPAEQRPMQATPKRILYGMRCTLTRIEVERDNDGRPTAAHAVMAMRGGGPGTLPGGFIFGAIERPLDAGERYVLDADPNDWSGFYANKVVEGLIAGETNALYERLAQPRVEAVPWPESAREGQHRFLDGLLELARRGERDFEPSKRAYIGEHGDAPILLVQGPPGTGKSFTTGYALFARLQGAMTAGIDFRIAVSCHTHAAIDVLLRNLVETKAMLVRTRSRYPDVFAAHFDERLLDVPIFRYRPSGSAPTGTIELKRKGESETLAVDAFQADRWSVLGATPSVLRGMIDERWKDRLFGHGLADCLVLDEASQLGLPTAIMAALPLKAEGRIIVVGDHRQMPPIIKHDWGTERRRTFREFRAFDSLFEALLAQRPRPPLIQFAESFRLHRDMAAYLRQQVYHHDGIDFHSQRRWQLSALTHDDPFVGAVLSADHALTVVIHEERQSQQSNAFERDLILDVARALYDERIYGTGEEESDGFGIVVPHRAQRAGFASVLLAYPDRVGAKPVIADTVERFQGDEREVIVYSATESDPAYLLTASKFLLDPRRLTVALSRAKRKLVLVASRSVFELFSPDEETFANAQLWRDLLRRTCTVPLWEGERHGVRVEVWGNASTE